MIGCLLLIGSALVGQVAVTAAEDLPTEVARLVRQLDDTQLARREAAEEALVALGPAILDLLPPGDGRLSAEVRQRLGRIRQQLERAAVDASTRGSTITLQADDIPLSELLAELEKQSGNAIGDAPTNPRLSVAFDRTPFWPALDQLLGQAGLTHDSHGQDAEIGIVAASASRRGRASYSGPFRFEPTKIFVRRNSSRPAAGSLVVSLEIAWEPQLRVLDLQLPMADVRAVDGRGDPLPAANPSAQLEVPVDGKTWSVGLDVPLQLPSRDVRQIADLKGKLRATIAGRARTFAFGPLSGAKNTAQRTAGVVVSLEEVRKTKTGVEIHLRVRYDDAGDALASHRQWIFNNPAYLVDKGPDAKPIVYDTYETTSQSENELGIAYRFRTDRPLDTLTFVYETPVAIVVQTFPYELKDIPIP